MGKKVVHFRKKYNDEGDKNMGATVKMKPIQATPELSGKDAINFIDQVFSKPDERAMKHNKNLLSILKKIQK